MHTVPFHIFQDEIAKNLIARGRYPGADWFRSQMGRVNLFHDHGETIDGAADVLAELALAVLSPRSATPLAVARKYGRVVRV